MFYLYTLGVLLISWWPDLFCYPVSEKCNNLASLTQYSMQIPLDSGVWERCRVTASSDFSPSPHSSSPSAMCYSHNLHLDSNMERMSYPCHSIPLPSFLFHDLFVYSNIFLCFYSRLIISCSTRNNKPPATWNYICFFSDYRLFKILLR